jgi:hypothetical protein
VLLVHCNGAKPALPEMAGAPAPGLDDAGITLVHARQRAAQPVRIGRQQNQMHVIRHQAPRPHRDPGSAAIVGEQVAVKRVIGVFEECAGATVATLGDVVRVTGDNDTGETGHDPSCVTLQTESI